MTESIEELYDLCIIGSGAVGSYLAHLTCKLNSKLRILVLEAGNTIPQSSKQLGIRFSHSDEYEATSKGLRFGLGGTSSIWGGLLAVYPKESIHAEDPKLSNSWSWILKYTEKHAVSVIADLLQTSHSRAKSIHEKMKLKIDDHCRQFAVAESIHLPFSSRNVFSLLRHSIENRVDIVENIVVRDFEVINDGIYPTIVGVNCLSYGENIKYKARKYVLCAGAIESTRILMEIWRDNKHGVPPDDLGKGLGEHLSMDIATLRKESKIKFRRKFIPRFYNSCLTTKRLALVKYSFFNKGFLHFNLIHKNDPYYLIRFLRDPAFEKKFSLGEACYSIVQLPFAVISRYLFSKIWVPMNTRVNLRLDISQIRSLKNQIFLTDEMDVHGRHIPKIHWEISDEDVERVSESIKFISKTDFFSSDVFMESVEVKNIYGAYHPVGTTMIGDHHDSPIATDFRVKGICNLYSISSGLLPEAGFANPTFTLLCFCRELTEYLGEELGSAS